MQCMCVWMCVCALVRARVCVCVWCGVVLSGACWCGAYACVCGDGENTPVPAVQHSVLVQPPVWSPQTMSAGAAAMSLLWLVQSNAPPVAPVMSAQVLEAAAEIRGGST